MCFYLLKRKQRAKPTIQQENFLCLQCNEEQGAARSVRIMRSRPARSIALKWSPYGGGLVSPTTGHSASSGLEQRRHGRAPQADSVGATRTASAGALLYEPRRRGAHLANHRARQRGVSSVCRQDTSALAKPATLFRRGCATNATHHGRSRAAAPRA